MAERVFDHGETAAPEHVAGRPAGLRPGGKRAVEGRVNLARGVERDGDRDRRGLARRRRRRPPRSENSSANMTVPPLMVSTACINRLPSSAACRLASIAPNALV